MIDSWIPLKLRLQASGLHSIDLTRDCGRRHACRNGPETYPALFQSWTLPGLDPTHIVSPAHTSQRPQTNCPRQARCCQASRASSLGPSVAALVIPFLVRISTKHQQITQTLIFRSILFVLGPSTTPQMQYNRSPRSTSPSVDDYSSNNLPPASPQYRSTSHYSNSSNGAQSPGQNSAYNQPLTVNPSASTSSRAPKRSPKPNVYSPPNSGTRESKFLLLAYRIYRGPRRYNIHQSASSTPTS
jgi:hypothetical protein